MKNVIKIETIFDVEKFIEQVVVKEGLGSAFHPDDNFDEYLCYSKEEAEERNKAISKSFAVCDLYGADIYKISLDITNRGK